MSNPTLSNLDHLFSSKPSQAPFYRPSSPVRASLYVHDNPALKRGIEVSSFMESLTSKYMAIPQDSVRYSKSDLLWASAHNDCDLILKLVDEGFDLNVTGHFGETPLHIAATLGHTQAAKLLIELGADPFLKAYEGYWNSGISAFELAMQEGHQGIIEIMFEYQLSHQFNDPYQIFLSAIEYNQANMISTLLEQGAHLSMEAQDLETIVWEKIFEIFDLIDEGKVSHKVIEDMAQTVMALAKATGTAWANEDYDIPPMGTVLEIIASKCQDFQTQQTLKYYAQEIQLLDNNHDLYVLNKSLFHLIPVDGSYDIHMQNQPNFSKPNTVDGEGFLHLYTVPLLQQNILHYIEQHAFESPSLHKAFASTLETVNLSAASVDKAGLFSTAQAFYDAYQKGESILLPSGWEGHAVDVLLNKDLNMLIIANQGDRHDAVKSGVNIYQMHNAEQVTPELIHTILNNEDKTFLELKLSIVLGLEGTDVIHEPDQFTGNCAWQSQESAMEGLLYMDLLQQGLDSLQAKQMAHEAYLEWDTFQTHAFAEYYFSQPLSIGSDVMQDLIKSQAYTLGTQELDVLKQDPTGQLLVQVYEKEFGLNAADVKLNYDPYSDFNLEELLELIDLFDLEPAPTLNTSDTTGQDTFVPISSVDFDYLSPEAMMEAHA